MNYIEALNWRYAVKQFSDEVIADDVINRLAEAARLSASSFGLQPYRLLVLRDKALREALLPYSYEQSKVVESSHLLVFAASTLSATELVDQYVERVRQVRPGTAPARLESMAEMMKDALAGMDAAALQGWAQQQAFIALGNVLSCAALEAVDACPMGGFEAAGYNAVLGLDDRNLNAAVICTLGVRHGDDYTAKDKKVRVSADEFVIYR